MIFLLAEEFLLVITTRRGIISLVGLWRLSYMNSVRLLSLLGSSEAKLKFHANSCVDPNTFKLYLIFLSGPISSLPLYFCVLPVIKCLKSHLFKSLLLRFLIVTIPLNEFSF